MQESWLDCQAGESQMMIGEDEHKGEESVSHTSHDYSQTDAALYISSRLDPCSVSITQPAFTFVNL